MRMVQLMPQLSIVRATRWPGFSLIKTAMNQTGRPFADVFPPTKHFDVRSRAKVVIHDLAKAVSFTITQDWDRSPGSLAVCCTAPASTAS